MPYDRVVIATDLSEASLAAAPLAAALASDRAKFTVVHVQSVMVPPPGISPMLIDELRETEADVRRCVEEWARDAKLPDPEVVLARGRIGHEVERVAREREADLVACGSRGRGRIERALLGSGARAILRHASCDVLVGREPVRGAIRKLVLATDFHDAAKAGGQRAAAIARRHGARLVVVHAIDPDMWSSAMYPASSPSPRREDAAWLRSTLSDMLSAFKAQHVEGRGEERLVVGRPPSEVSKLAEAEGADLLVVGAHGASLVERWLLGSVAESLAEQAPCSVLMVRPK